MIAAGLCAQAPAPGGPVFEVASVKPSAPGARGMSINRNGGRITTENVPLRFLITFAWDVRDFQITGGPGWLSSDRWDISAKPEGDIQRGPEGETKIRAMMRALLSERFGLTLHTETKELPVYALVIAKNGPKLEPSSGKSEVTRISMSRGQMNVTNFNMATVARELSSQLGRIVIDETGLKGDYTFKLEFAPEQNAIQKPVDGPEKPEIAPESDRPSLFTALQEQLGLRLESKKGPVQILVIDKVEKATEN
jgi:bla regulator protein BlaR1